jgi:uncharacterized protein with PIN domain
VVNVAMLVAIGYMLWNGSHHRRMEQLVGEVIEDAVGAVSQGVS